MRIMRPRAVKREPNHKTAKAHKQEEWHTITVSVVGRSNVEEPHYDQGDYVGIHWRFVKCFCNDTSNPPRSEDKQAMLTSMMST